MIWPLRYGGSIELPHEAVVPVFLSVYLYMATLAGQERRRQRRRFYWAKERREAQERMFDAEINADNDLLLKVLSAMEPK